MTFITFSIFLARDHALFTLTLVRIERCLAAALVGEAVSAGTVHDLASTAHWGLVVIGKKSRNTYRLPSRVYI